MAKIKQEQRVIGPASPKQAAFLSALDDTDIVLFGGAAQTTGCVKPL